MKRPQMKAMYFALAVVSALAAAIYLPQLAKLVWPDYTPEVAIQNEDYATARSRFHTKLLKRGPAPQDWEPLKPPAGVTEVRYPSGPLRLKAWVNRPANSDHRRYPAVLFLHGGYSFALSDWQTSQPYRNAGFVVLSPLLRGENGQAGVFSMFYDEVEDVVSAAEYLRKQPYVDANRLYVAGHSIGGTMVMLSAMTYQHFRAAAALSGSPDQILFIRYAPDARTDVPFDLTDPRETQMRSPLAYVASLKCPLRIYYGSEENYFFATTRRMVELARKHNLDVEALMVDGNHNTHVPASIKLSIEFFRKMGEKSRAATAHS
jgi:dipeptidyl aminopeptidase/acylaminoacyl peptidase